MVEQDVFAAECFQVPPPGAAHVDSGCLRFRVLTGTWPMSFLEFLEVGTANQGRRFVDCYRFAKSRSEAKVMSCVKLRLSDGLVLLGSRANASQHKVQFLWQEWKVRGNRTDIRLLHTGKFGVEDDASGLAYNKCMAGAGDGVRRR